jgi:hypothetical protein
VFTEKDLEDHRIIASGMDWDDLVDIIISLELEKYEMSEILSKSQIKIYDKIIDIYEVEKISIVSKYQRVYNNTVYRNDQTYKDIYEIDDEDL